jgi:hypothetical protein
VSYGSGKIFPAGTLPSGTAANEPTQPVKGIAPIGDWTTRGQIAFPFPPVVAQYYNSTPTFFANQYYLLGDGRTALTHPSQFEASGRPRSFVFSRGMR